ncbi:MAG: hypothetical protein CMP73_01110 [Flavobacteriales bacterium]|nr:hypothetical protein [Flavobacteriales bacterium]|tara:strand:+ start:488 stop:1462 length:975 start_codon:yes stop_codon:yes gene_type:complete
MKKHIALVFLYLCLFGCEQTEIPIVPASNGPVISTQIELGNNYAKQIFYNIKDSSIVSENIKTAWDIGLENGPEGYRIKINSSTYSQIIKIENANFENTISVPNSAVWGWDNAISLFNNTYIGDYRNSKQLFILDRGYNENGEPRGIKKFRVDSITEKYYILTHSNLDNSEMSSCKIDKTNGSSVIRFSFENNSPIEEPLDSEWDLLFTQYTHLYINNDANPSYLVTGVLINSSSGIEVAIDSVTPFLEINENSILNYTFSNNQNIIGYNWKEYNFESQYYYVKDYISYIIKDSKGRYFKLRYIDFYNSIGEKGAPMFEYQLFN